MPPISLRWRAGARCAALGAAALAISMPAGGAVAATRAVAVALAGAGAVRHASTGAPHSPQLLAQLAAPARGPQASALIGTGAAAPMTSAGLPGEIKGAVQGVDVASYQHPKTSKYPKGAPIDWAAVAGAGIRFAAVKATEGDYYTNPYARTDLAGAKAAGLAVAAYAFAVPDGDGGSSDPVTQADDLLNYLGSAAVTGPLMLDIEYDPYASSDGTNECYGLTPAAMVAWISAFTGELQARTARPPIIYTAPAWWAACTGDSTAFSGYPLWVPDFSGSGSPASTASWASWSFWQYGSTGTVPGIDDAGRTDVDQLNLMTPPGRRVTAGSPADFTVGQADPAAGQAPVFSASGLPAGYSMSAAGQIHGWALRAGTSAVTVTDSALDGLGSARFTWTVRPAAGNGPAGEVRFGAGGRCLGLAGNRAALGAAAILRACDGRGPQRWTVAADRTLRIDGKCLSVSGPAAANGARVVLGACNGTASQQWSAGTGARLVDSASGKCLASSPRGGNGSPAWISSCNGRPNQKWMLPAGRLLSGLPGRCAGEAGGPAAGKPVVLSACNGSAAGRWVAEPDGTIRVAGRCLGLTGTAAGARVAAFPCRGSSTQHWQIGTGGAGLQVRSGPAGLCLSDPGDATASGTALVLGACSAGDPGTAWRLP